MELNNSCFNSDVHLPVGCNEKSSIMFWGREREREMRNGHISILIIPFFRPFCVFFMFYFRSSVICFLKNLVHGSVNAFKRV